MTLQQIYQRPLKERITRLHYLALLMRRANWQCSGYGMKWCSQRVRAHKRDDSGYMA